MKTVKAKTENKNHPELQEGEVFLTNAFDDRIPMHIDDYVDDRSDWESIGWRSKRMGEVAYDIYGNPINGMFPVFVGRDELIKGGINPDTLWDE